MARKAKPRTVPEWTSDRHVRADDPRPKRWAAFLRGGATVAEIAQQEGLTLSRVYQLLHAHGIDPQALPPPPRPHGGRYAEALDMQARARAWLRTPDGVANVHECASRYEQATPAQREAFGRNLGVLLDHALEVGETYWWAPEVCRTVAAAAVGMPDWRLADEAIPGRAGYWWFAEPLPLPPHRGEPVGVRALAWLELYRDEAARVARLVPASGTPARRELHAVCFYHQRGEPWGYPALVVPWPLGSGYEEALDAHFEHGELPEDRERIRQDYRYLAAALAFLQQRIYVAPAHEPDRAARRRHESWRPEPTVRVVELRRREARGDRSDEPAPVDWRYQWVTRGHWRQQPYPSLGRVQPRWIASYVKGPPDRPLKPPKPTVFAVQR